MATPQLPVNPVAISTRMFASFASFASFAGGEYDLVFNGTEAVR
jgi:hypothetical protein